MVALPFYLRSWERKIQCKYSIREWLTIQMNDHTYASSTIWLKQQSLLQLPQISLSRTGLLLPLLCLQPVLHNCCLLVPFGLYRDTHLLVCQCCCPAAGLWLMPLLPWATPAPLAGPCTSKMPYKGHLGGCSGEWGSTSTRPNPLPSCPHSRWEMSIPGRRKRYSNKESK